MTIGGLGASGYIPIRAITSAKFSPAARTSMTTSPSPACGSGRSSTFSTDGSPWAVLTTARMSAEQGGVGLFGAALPERRVQRRTRDQHGHDPGDEAPDADPHGRAHPQQARRVVVGDEPVVVHRLDEEPEQDQPPDRGGDDVGERRARTAPHRAAEVP